ncbi:Rod shape determining protein RodA [Lacicoccus alkaliphilus]|uniref:Rod shape determining protein RodA n=1 Tax=Lacicoccus alkaliphilus DSM 16010 TaxID=1123231 RepID=A0A1M7GMV0_9BACL|nr:rod shape determining protein RodA [Salinicoccus alkaliphilus DSM 16010]
MYKSAIINADRVKVLKVSNQAKRQNISLLQRIDWTLIIFLTALAVISVIAINSAMIGGQHNINFGTRQIIFYILGFIAMFILTFIPVKFFKQFVWLIFGGSLLVLFILYISPVSSVTPIINGAQRWFQIGGMSIQPSEFAKITYILALGYIISEHNKYRFSHSLDGDVKLLSKMLLLSILPVFFVLSQNDMGTTIVFIAILLGMILVSGVSWWLILPTVGITGAVGSILLFGVIYRPDLLQTYLRVSPYQFDRIYSWLRPDLSTADSSFQITSSLRAIGSGGIEGRGLGEGVVYIPESHTDFIFTIIGEELGFLGSTLVIILFFLLTVHLIRIAFTVKDSFSSYFIIGYLTMIWFQVFQNIGMTIQLLPITGLTLPFLSYGGSSLWANMVGMGIIMSIYYHQYSVKS